MADIPRVARWRQRNRDAGKQALTIWLTVEDKARLLAMAHQWHTSPSALVTAALAQFHPGHPPSFSHDPDTSPIPAMIQAQLPAMVEAIVKRYLSERQETPIQYSDAPATIPIRHRGTAETAQRRLRNVPETSRPQQRKARAGRPRSPLGQRILDLLAQHPEGLSAEQIRGYLSPERPIGDTLAGMRRTGVIRVEGKGNTRRYSVG